MDPQDQNSPSTTPISSLVPDASLPPVPPTAIPPVGAPTPFPVAQVPTYNAQHVQIEGNVEAVPQENIGLGQEAPVPSAAPEYQAEAAIPGIVPAPADRLQAPAEVFPMAEPEQTPEAPLSVVPESTSSMEPTPVSVPVPDPEPVLLQPEVGATQQLPETSVEGAENPEAAESGESQKTPLEILEEILASANENPAEGSPGADGASGDADKATADAQALAEEEAKQAAALAAETSRYQQEAEQRIVLAQQDIQDAAQQRVDVTQQLQSEGKQVGATVSTPEDQAFAIQQLEHDTLTQKSD